MSRHAIHAVAVVVPARDEEVLITASLESIERAARALRQWRPGLSQITVVADDASCDATAAIARTFDGVHVTRSAGGNVGRARAAGINRARLLIGVPAAHLWIANTDADTVVPDGWLREQVILAEQGADAIIGTVQPTFEHFTPEQIEAWLADNRPGVALGHVHGANLGMRASAYDRVEGFSPLSEHEDVELAERLRRSGARVVHSGSAEVPTSGRLHGRTAGGFAGYLRTQLLPVQRVVP